MYRASFQLKEKYERLLKENRLDLYLKELSEEGLNWWFEMDTPSLRIHLEPLKILSASLNLPPRIAFLLEASKQTIPYEQMRKYYRLFSDSGDTEAEAAAIGAVVASIWDSGRQFSRYREWKKKIEDVLKSKDSILSPLARASLMGFKGLIELTGEDIKSAYQTYVKQRTFAEMANSHSLMVYFAAAGSYSLIWMGRLPEAEMVIKDAEVLSDSPDVNIAVRTYFQTTRALYYYVIGEGLKAESILKETVSMPFFDDLPPPAYFLGYGHLLLALARRGDTSEIEQLARKLRERAVPENNYFHLSYLHYNLGSAYLLLGDPQRALVHANESMERAELSESSISPNISALLFGQALSELERFDEAMEHIRGWMLRWQSNGFYLLASSGCLEMANIYYRLGMIERARAYFEEAERMIQGGNLIFLNRSRDLLSSLKRRIFPSTPCGEIVIDINRTPICIKTFGDLEIRVGDRVIYDRKWRGSRTKTLLKALIVHGGTKVSYDLLKDLLWPEADGDVAENSLKVAISRLRRMVSSGKGKPVQWILVKQRKVSLARSICGVDSIVFKEYMDNAFKEEPDVAELMKVLELYQDDFLARDQSETWIIRHREILKEDFVRAVIYLSRICSCDGNITDATRFLNRAIDKDPLNEEVYAALMGLYLQGGFPTKAIKVYQQAKDVLRNELDIAPGARLQELARKAGLKI